MIRNSLYILVLTLLAFFSFSCRKTGPGCVGSSGEMRYEERTPPAGVDSLEILGEMDVFLSQSPSPRLYLHSGENLLPGIETRQTGRKLTIEDFNTCSFLRDMGLRTRVFVTLSNYRYISFRSSGLIQSKDTIRSDTFSIQCREGAGSVNLLLNTGFCALIQHSGTGAVDFTAKGTSGTVFILCNGYGPFDCRNLHSGYTHVVNRGSNHCYVNSSSILQAEIWHTGNIYYTGGPSQIWTFGDGSGKLLPLIP